MGLVKSPGSAGGGWDHRSGNEVSTLVVGGAGLFVGCGGDVGQGTGRE